MTDITTTETLVNVKKISRDPDINFPGREIYNSNANCFGVGIYKSSEKE